MATNVAPNIANPVMLRRELQRLTGKPVPIRLTPKTVIAVLAEAKQPVQANQLASVRRALQSLAAKNFDV